MFGRYQISATSTIASWLPLVIIPSTIAGANECWHHLFIHRAGSTSATPCILANRPVWALRMPIVDMANLDAFLFWSLFRKQAVHSLTLRKTASILPGIYEFLTSSRTSIQRQQQFPIDTATAFGDIPIVGVSPQNHAVFFRICGQLPQCKPHLAKPDPVPIASLMPMQLRWCWRTRSSGVLPCGSIGLNFNRMNADICVCSNTKHNFVYFAVPAGICRCTSICCVCVSTWANEI